MKKWFAFVSGAVFALAMVITCGGGDSSKPAADAGGTSVPVIPSGSDTIGSNTDALWTTVGLDAPWTGTGKDLSVITGDAKNTWSFPIIGIDSARAQTPTRTTWEYAVVEQGPRGQFFFGNSTIDCSTCFHVEPDTVGSDLQRVTCCASLAGAQGWEAYSFYLTNGGYIIGLKRPK